MAPSFRVLKIIKGNGDPNQVSKKKHKTMYYGNFSIGSGQWGLMDPWRSSNLRKLINDITSYIRMSTPKNDYASWRVWNDDGELVAKGHFAWGRFFRDPF